MTYDGADGYVVFFGGSYGAPQANYYTNGTWKFLNGSWSNITGLVHGPPSARDRAPLVYDGATKTVLLFGGQRSIYPTNGSYLNDTWSYSAYNWSLVSANSGFSPRENMLVTYDAADGSVVGFGGFGLVRNVTANGTVEYLETDLADTLTYVGGTWTLQAPLLVANRAVLDTGAPLDLTVIGIGPTFSGRFAYIGLPAGCVSASTTRLNCSASQPGTYRPAVEVDNGADSISWASTRLQVNPSPSIASFTPSTNGVLFGTSLRLNVATAGGTGPFRFDFKGLPPGCADANVSSLVCSPTAPGNYTVAVTISDACGETASAQVVLRILSSGAPPPTPTPSTHPPGQSAGLWGTYEGGLLVGVTAFVVVVVWALSRRQLDRQSSALVRSLESPATGDGPPHPTGDDPPDSGPRV
jgi:hypothetical protein